MQQTVKTRRIRRFRFRKAKRKEEIVDKLAGVMSRVSTFAPSLKLRINVGNNGSERSLMISEWNDHVKMAGALEKINEIFGKNFDIKELSKMLFNTIYSFILIKELGYIVPPERLDSFEVVFKKGIGLTNRSGVEVKILNVDGLRNRNLWVVGGSLFALSYVAWMLIESNDDYRGNEVMIYPSQFGKEILESWNQPFVDELKKDLIRLRSFEEVMDMVGIRYDRFGLIHFDLDSLERRLNLFHHSLF